MKVVTKKPEHGWAFYTILAYFGFFFLQPIFDHAGWKEWSLTALGTVVFLALYFGVVWTERKPWQLAGLGAMVVVGALYAPFNTGACCFFIFAAALLPYFVENELVVLSLIAVILAVGSKPGGCTCPDGLPSTPPGFPSWSAGPISTLPSAPACTIS